MKNKQKKETKKKKVSTGKIVTIGAGVAAIGAGAYYFLGPNAKANQKKAKVWMEKMEKEVVNKMKTIEKVSEPIYHKTVDSLAENYSKQYKEYAPEIKIFAEHLKNGWKGFEKKTKPASRKPRKTPKKK